MTDKAKALVERCKGHTPGPWRWEVNRSHKSVKLCGGSPKHGFGRYDLTVMDFSRYGMNKAAPVFWNWQDGPFLVGDPKRADELAVEVQGREHHANWFADIDHPDAQLVAAAPELLALIETQAREIERLREALKHIGIYGCGMLNQPAAMNGPEEVWLKQRIFEMERTARAALGDSHDQ